MLATIVSRLKVSATLLGVVPCWISIELIFLAVSSRAPKISGTEIEASVGGVISKVVSVAGFACNVIPLEPEDAEMGRVVLIETFPVAAL